MHIALRTEPNSLADDVPVIVRFVNDFVFRLCSITCGPIFMVELGSSTTIEGIVSGFYFLG